MPLLAKSQKRHFFLRSHTKQEEEQAIKRDQCFQTNKYNISQRRAFFPFKDAASIELVSFEGLMQNAPIRMDGEPPVNINPWDTTELFIPIAVNHFKINNHRIKERVTLTNNGIDSLTDIFYNISFTPIKVKLEIANPGFSCYNPRNAILFKNESGELTQYIEFCFECGRYYLSSSKIENTDYCEQKFDIIKAFFLTHGLKWGTVLPKQE